MDVLRQSADSPLPGIDQVLSQADTGMGASDGDLSVSRALHRVGNLDLSPWHLTDLIDLCALTADDAANELGYRKKNVTPSISLIPR